MGSWFYIRFYFAICFPFDVIEVSVWFLDTFLRMSGISFRGIRINEIIIVIIYFALSSDVTSAETFMCHRCNPSQVSFFGRCVDVASDRNTVCENLRGRRFPDARLCFWFHAYRGLPIWADTCVSSPDQKPPRSPAWPIRQWASTLCYIRTQLSYILACQYHRRCVH